MDFEAARKENDELFLVEKDSIARGEKRDVLVPFAKAYLGMFYVIDNQLPAAERLRMLASPALAEAIEQGFRAVLKQDNWPELELIAEAFTQHREYNEGYIFLAAMDLLAKEDRHFIAGLDRASIQRAILFNFSINTGYQKSWFEELLQRHKPKVIEVMTAFWVALLEKGASYIPGRNFIFSDQPDLDFVKQAILPLLLHWQDCRVKKLRQLLQLAFRYADGDAFLEVCEQVLKQENRLNEKTRLLWVASAYFLDPVKYASLLSTYIGRVKLKIMPLLDFTIVLLADRKTFNIEISDKSIVQLLRIIAPIFPPQHHVYGAFGKLDINSRNVMQLFYALLLSDNQDVAAEVKSLRKARVMKIYSAVLDDLLQLLMRKRNEENFEVPDFDSYIENLVKNNCLQGRSNRFDKT